MTPPTGSDPLSPPAPAADGGRVPALARAAREASRRLATVPDAVRRNALLAVSDALSERAGAILSANEEDQVEARPRVDAGEMSASLFARLVLTPAKLAEIVDGVRAVAALPDPTGRVLSRTLLDDGLELVKVTCPLGVLAVIFEARPDAGVQIASLALRSGNALLLKGGREAARSNEALIGVFHDVLASFPAIPPAALTLLSGREEVAALLAEERSVDLVIPRGSNELVRSIQASTRIPVMGHAEGVCHVYVDAAADPAMSIEIVRDAKLQYPAACNAVETVLVHVAAAARVLEPLLLRLAGEGVEVRACGRTRALAPGRTLRAAVEEDWRTEHSGPVLSLRLVDSLEEAIEHVNRYGSGHTDAIVTGDAGAAERFLLEVDSASVFHNASTRFADGFRYGLGAEVGIATGKLHARGPVGLEGLVTYKWKLYGHGQVVATYSGAGRREFRHRPLPT